MEPDLHHIRSAHRPPRHLPHIALNQHHPHHHYVSPALSSTTSSPLRAGQDLDQAEKLAVVYASPPLSPSAQRSALDQPLGLLKGRSTGMDSNDRRQRQITQAGYGQQAILQTSPQYPATSAASDRYRQSQITAQSPTSAPSAAARSGSIHGYNYPYSESAQFAGAQMQTSALQYQTEYGHEQQRPQQGYQQYGATNLAGMYNVPAQQQQQPQQPQAQQQQQPTQSAYESVTPYQPQPRQSAAIEVLSTQFGVPQQYYASGDTGPTSAPAVALAAQNVHSQYNTMSYTTQSPVGRETLAPAYAAGMTDTAQTSSQAAYGQQAGYGSQQASQSAELDVAYGQYQQELRRTFESVRDGRLAEAGTSLVHISDWLLGNAEALGKLGAACSTRELDRTSQLILTIGLVRDDENMHGERLKLWAEFNNCWLATLQRQRELSLGMAETGHRPSPPQSLMEYEHMENMGKELVRLCDVMEKHGLVDYQMGVWEEEILNRKLAAETPLTTSELTLHVPQS